MPCITIQTKSSVPVFQEIEKTKLRKLFHFHAKHNTMVFLHTFSTYNNHFLIIMKLREMVYFLSVIINCINFHGAYPEISTCFIFFIKTQGKHKNNIFMFQYKTVRLELG